MAVQRRQPTFSPRNNAAPAAALSGTAWKMMMTFANGMLKSATR
jgi:hypothetical protein